MARHLSSAAVVLFLSVLACGQSQKPAKPQPHSRIIKPSTPDKAPWDFSLTVDGYLIEGEDGYAQPTFRLNQHTAVRSSATTISTLSRSGGFC